MGDVENIRDLPCWKVCIGATAVKTDGAKEPIYNAVLIYADPPAEVEKIGRRRLLNWARDYRKPYNEAFARPDIVSIETDRAVFWVERAETDHA